PVEPEPAPTRSARRAQRTRTRLEKAALSAFVEVGVGATTIEMITERADLGKGTFYQHFSTKEELLALLVDAAVENLLARIAKAVEGRGDLRSTIEALVNAHLDHFEADREEFILFFQGHGALNLLGSTPEDLEASYLHYLERLESIVRERLPASPGDVTLRRMACAIAGFAVGYLSFALVGLSEENLRETYRPIRETLVNGLTTLVERSLSAPVAAGERPPSTSPPPVSTMTSTPP
ncbi:MAG: TetR/AcrR family transcriptional regulator, partial [Thermoanaerobaculia bacterium]